MKLRILTTAAVAVLASIAFADDNDPIEAAMKFVHKAPKGEKKVSDRIIDGTASDEEVKKTVELYKLAAVAKPPKGDEAGYKEKFAKLLAATEDVAAKKEGAAAAYKAAVNCKACHSEHKPD
jgi:hypothetical protein